jgi:NAD(P)-dependent dehydrogenase (short-subunit alcohol dehydrogenase family)
VINNAGVLDPIERIENLEPSAWERNLAVNLLGPIYLSSIVTPYLRTQKGKLIHVSSGAAVSAIIGWGAYCASKAALNHFNKVLALEETDITCLTFRPGVVDTDMQAYIRSTGQDVMIQSEYEKFIKYKKFGELLPPELPGEALIKLAMFAPKSWSGDFVQWNEDRVSDL